MKKPNYFYSLLVTGFLWVAIFLVGWFLYLSPHRTEYISLESSWLILGVPLIAFLYDSLFHAIKKAPVTVAERVSQMLGILLANLVLPFMLFNWFHEGTYYIDFWNTFLYLCAASCYFVFLSAWPFRHKIKLLISNSSYKEPSRLSDFSISFLKCFASAAVVGTVVMFFTTIVMYSNHPGISLLPVVFVSVIIIYAVEPVYLLVVLFTELIRHPYDASHRIARISALTLFYFLPILLHAIPALFQQRWEWFSLYSSYGLSWLFLFITICGMHDCAIHNHHISESIHGSN